MNSNLFADARIAETYEAWYAASADAARAEATTLLRARRRDFAQPGATRLVEIGCGTGRFARIFAAPDYRVVGADASAAILEQARAKTSLPCVQAE